MSRTRRRAARRLFSGLIIVVVAALVVTRWELKAVSGLWWMEASYHDAPSSVTHKQTEERINRLKGVIMEGLQQQLHNKTQHEKKKKIMMPPNTPGAFVHVGKTGGSSIAIQLRYACHSFVFKPCPHAQNIRHESPLSHLVTYYHVPDFELDLLSKYEYDFYVFSVRDPFDRTISAFTFLHPDNMRARKDHVLPGSNYLHLKRIFACFPTLESFTFFLSPQKTVTENCPSMAQGLMHQQFIKASHFYFDLTKLTSSILNTSREQQTNDNDNNNNNNNDNNNTTRDPLIFLLRTEHLWQDYTKLNRLLVADPTLNVTTFPTDKRRQQPIHKMPVSKQLTPEGKTILCQSLKEEYKLYFYLLYHAPNLEYQDFLQSVAYSKTRCPLLVKEMGL